MSILGDFFREARPDDEADILRRDAGSSAKDRIVAAVRAAASPARLFSGARDSGNDPIASRAHEGETRDLFADGRALGLTEGALAERQRIAAILNDPNATGRGQLARSLAIDSGLSPDDASKLLAAAAIEAPKTPSLFDEMRGFTQPALGCDGGPSLAGMSDYEKGASEAKRLLGK